MPDHDRSGEWRLGGETTEPLQLEPPRLAPAGQPRPRRERLQRPLYVLTVEGVLWLVLAAYAAATRLVGLGVRPLDAGEAGRASGALALVHANSAATPTILSPGSIGILGWPHFLTAGLFASAGASDLIARVVAALCGLLLIAMAFALRRELGRAGAIALGTLLTLSPGFTWFSRDVSAVTPALALTLATLAMFFALRNRRRTSRAALFGIVAGLMLAAEPFNLVTGVILLVALIPIGLGRAVTRRRRWLNLRIWLDRYGGHCALVLIPAAITWAIVIVASLGLHPTLLREEFAVLRPHFDAATIRANAQFYLPAIALNEFMLVGAAALGLIAFITLRLRSGFAVWCLLWTALSIAYWSAIPPQPERLLIVLLPLAVFGSLGVNWLYSTRLWPVIRFPIAVMVIVTAYVQILGNFVYAVPTVDEAPWARHGSLYWDSSATTAETPARIDEATGGLAPAAATVFFADNAPALHWYLRNLRPVADADTATVIASSPAGPAASLAGLKDYDFTLAESWRPTFANLTFARALRYLVTAQLWGAPTFQDARLVVGEPPRGPAPTVILTPPG